MNQITVADGFRFGCGFMLAAFIVWLAIAIVGGILAAIFGTAVGSVFGNLMGQVPQLLVFV